MRTRAVVCCLASGVLLTTASYSAPATTVEPTSALEIRLAPGDDKNGYARSDYQTDSLSLEYRRGQPADLLAIANKRHLGLPPLPVTSHNQPDARRINLGRKLFFDRRLSRNKTMSCAMCHIPEQGFTNNELARPIGFEGRAIKRNAPTILNVAYYQALFADARENKLEQQIWSPLLAANEMNNPSVGFVIDTITGNADYNQLFEQAFASKPNMLNVGMALAQYQRTLVAADSPFDRWYFGKQKGALDALAIRGFGLFAGRARCSTCHTVGVDYALFTDNLLHNTGVGYADSMLTRSPTLSVQLAPGVTAELDRDVVASVGQDKPNDLGRYEVTLDPGDRWKYRTSSLRNVALTAPYMHDGKFQTLMDVVTFYNQGGQANKLLSPLIQPLALTDVEQLSIVAFLKSLTGSNVEILVADAFSAAIGDTVINSDDYLDEK